MTMKMMRSTIMMSAMGVTLMSAIGPPDLPPTAIDMGSCSYGRPGPEGPRPVRSDRQAFFLMK